MCDGGADGAGQENSKTPEKGCVSSSAEQFNEFSQVFLSLWSCILINIFL